MSWYNANFFHVAHTPYYRGSRINSGNYAVVMYRVNWSSTTDYSQGSILNSYYWNNYLSHFLDPLYMYDMIPINEKTRLTNTFAITST